MFKNYILIAFRNILKQKVYTLVNMLGLAIGIAIFVLISLFITNELKYDKHHSKWQRIYRVVNIVERDGVGEESSSCPFPLAPALLAEHPDKIEAAVRFFNLQTPTKLIEYNAIKYNEPYFFFTDSSFFDVFDIELIEGNAKEALNDVSKTIISESTAKRYFGNQPALGEIITLEGGIPLIITGVFRDVPSTSHFKYEFLTSIVTLKSFFGGIPRNWIWNPCWTYILLKDNKFESALANSFPRFIDKNMTDDLKAHIQFYLQPLADIHLYSQLDYEIESNSNILFLYILGMIAVSVLIIAIMNFINLSTAASSKRFKEIGIRKITGSTRNQLIIQFLSESLLMSFIALFFALIIVELLLPGFNYATDRNLAFSALISIQSILYLLLLGIVTGFLAGLYPAFYLSSFQPIQVLKGIRKRGISGGRGRKVLVVVQFSISIVLIIVTFINYKQLNFLYNADLGFKKNDIIILPVSNNPLLSDYEGFKEDLLKMPEIEYVTGMFDILGVSHNTRNFTPIGFPQDRAQFYPEMIIEYDFLETFEIKTVAGRGFDSHKEADRKEAVMINEAMVRHLGLTNNNDALGKTMYSINGNEKVIGVINNFNVNSLHSKVSPFVLHMLSNDSHFLKYLAIRIKNGTDEQALKYIQKVWRDYSPERPFEYKYLSDEINNLYKGEAMLSKLIVLLTALAIFIATIGVLGLVSFLTEQRTHEIGIRKALGAGITDIVIWLSSEFIRLIIIANVLAWPVAYIISYYWLQSFAYTTTISIWFFPVAGLMALFISQIMVVLQTWRAALTSPAVALQYE